MAVRPDYLNYVLEQLGALARVTTRRMFGAVGLYSDAVFFAIIDNDTLFFKADDVTRADYVSRGMAPFQPYEDRPDVSMNYYTVPADTLEDSEDLVAWARRAVEAARRTSRAKVKRPRAEGSSKPARKKRAPKPAAKRSKATRRRKVTRRS